MPRLSNTTVFPYTTLFRSATTRELPADARQLLISLPLSVSVDRHVLRLIKLWLEAPVEERDGDGARRMTGGKGSRRGTPQRSEDTRLNSSHSQISYAVYCE